MQTVDGSMQMSNGPVQTVDGSMQMSNGPVQTVDGSMQTSNGPVQTINWSLQTINLLFPVESVRYSGSFFDGPGGSADALAKQRKHSTVRANDQKFWKKNMGQSKIGRQEPV